MDNVIPIPRGYSKDEAVQILVDRGYKITARSLDRARSAGVIPTRRIGGKIRYTMQDLVNYIEHGEQKWQKKKVDLKLMDTGSLKPAAPTHTMPAGMKAVKEEKAAAGALAKSLGKKN